MLEGLTPIHLIIVLVVALLILGPGKLPETGAALGKAVRDFRRGMSDDITPAAPASLDPIVAASTPTGETQGGSATDR